MAVLEKRTEMPVPPEELYRWHAREGAFERLVPPWERVEVLERQGGIGDGGRLVMRNQIGPMPVTWVADHKEHVEGRQFQDVQTSGPFSRWVHTHRFEPVEGAPERSVLVDHIDYVLPAGAAGDLVAGAPVRERLERMFAWRHQRTLGDLQRHADFAEKPRRTVAITGASGLIGRNLAAMLSTGGHSVRRLVRRAPRAPGEVRWDPEGGSIDLDGLAGVDAIVHLAGEDVAAGAWTDKRKELILGSREKGTALIADAAVKLRPEVLLSASAVGLYGDTGELLVDEDGPHGSDFLATVCAKWEAAAEPARAAGLRVVHPRIGVVMSLERGPLEKLRLPYSLGLGGPVGTGRQYMAWISLDDVVDSLYFMIMNGQISGALNAVSPAPVTSRGFASTFGGVLGRPAVVPLPAFAVRAAFGEMGEWVLLRGQRVAPRRLQEAGFTWRFADLEATIRNELGL